MTSKLKANFVATIKFETAWAEPDQLDRHINTAAAATSCFAELKVYKENGQLLDKFAHSIEIAAPVVAALRAAISHSEKLEAEKNATILQEKIQSAESRLERLRKTLAENQRVRQENFLLRKLTLVSSSSSDEHFMASVLAETAPPPPGPVPGEVLNLLAAAASSEEPVPNSPKTLRKPTLASVLDDSDASIELLPSARPKKKAASKPQSSSQRILKKRKEPILTRAATKRIRVAQSSKENPRPKEPGGASSSSSSSPPAPRFDLPITERIFSKSIEAIALARKRNRKFNVYTALLNSEFVKRVELQYVARCSAFGAENNPLRARARAILQEMFDNIPVQDPQVTVGMQFLHEGYEGICDLCNLNRFVSQTISYEEPISAHAEPCTFYVGSECSKRFEAIVNWYNVLYSIADWLDRREWDVTDSESYWCDVKPHFKYMAKVRSAIEAKYAPGVEQVAGPLDLFPPERRGIAAPVERWSGSRSAESEDSDFNAEKDNISDGGVSSSLSN